MLGEAYELILFFMRDQTAVPALFDEDLAVDNIDTDLITNIDGIALFPQAPSLRHNPEFQIKSEPDGAGSD